MSHWMLCVRMYDTYITLFLFYMYTAPTLMVTTAISNNQVIVGNREVVTCTVSGAVGVNLSSVMISWTGPGGAIIANDSRVTISPTTSSGDYFLSTLRFEFLMEGDGGTYSCNVTILDTTVSGIRELSGIIGILTFCI